MRNALLCILVTSLLGACALKQPPAQLGTWIRFDGATKRYSIAATGVPRGKLLDQLEGLASVKIRPQPERETPVTANATGQTLDELIVLLLPPGARYKLGLGERDRELDVKTPRKEGAAETRDPALLPKRESATELVREGRLKVRPEEYASDRPVTGPNTKRAAEELIAVNEKNSPRVPKQTSAARNTVRLTLAFQDGAAPQLVAAQAIEGNTTSMRFVTGPYLYIVLGGDGRPVQYGSFQDPLTQHSYLQEGPHDLTRATSGFAGISVARESLQNGRLVIVDASSLTLPRELNDDLIGGILKRSKPIAEFDERRTLRLLDEGARQ